MNHTTAVEFKKTNILILTRRQNKEKRNPRIVLVQRPDLDVMDPLEWLIVVDPVRSASSLLSSFDWIKVQK